SHRASGRGDALPAVPFLAAPGRLVIGHDWRRLGRSDPDGTARASSVRRALHGFAEVEIAVELPRRDEVFQLLQARERAVVEDLLGHGDALEDLVQLAGPARRRCPAAEARQVTGDLGEGDAIASGVGAGRPEAQGAAGKGRGDELGDVADAVILLVAADVEDLAMDGVARRLNGENDRGADIADMDQRAPR